MILIVTGKERRRYTRRGMVGFGYFKIYGLGV